ncbi:hypothetical protein [Pelagibacterium lacus]|uniref:Uncharacterized protein n=1 Tax=Pelagibacterium lacus TaxID=2282655 RepID=A0A369WDZ5_9HYPH|nr:hypothetical protein [Pelagibacterium lacus]RDE10351.1 hypothetical protein DVH29_02900 [Pelagibacterium lacus]
MTTTTATSTAIVQPLEFVADSDRPFLGRRMSWEEFYKMRPDLRPANDNDDQSHPKKVQKLVPRTPRRGHNARIHN